jgi:threonine dehydratase
VCSSDLEHQLVVEPSGAAPVAALRKVGRSFAGGGAIAVVVTGRNVNRERYFELLGVERRAAGAGPTGL